MEFEFTVMIERDEDGVFIATVPALRGCHSAGRTEVEALEHVREAIQLHVELLRERGESIPTEGTITRVRVPLTA
ncbi:MAG: type II toxin-antitoxin system HicB family antitoxin [Chloroflexota bacterium]|nr:type II toxin-antitoxin system HicB family antitoxin [Chloroflexota bacterium]